MTLLKLHRSYFVLIYQVVVFLFFQSRPFLISKLIAISGLGRGAREHGFTRPVGGNISGFLLPFPDHQVKLMLAIFCSQTRSGLIFMEAMAEVARDGFLWFGFVFE